MKTDSHALTTFSLRRNLSWHSPMLGLTTAAAIVVYIFVDAVAEPRIKDATSFVFTIIGIVKLSYVIFTCTLFISGVVLLLRRKLFLSACYLAASAVTCASCFLAAALKDDRLTFPSGSHREIAGIYHEQGVDFDVKNPVPHLVYLDQQCHPPGGCECWVLIDVGRRSVIKNDLGGWRRPTAPIFLRDSLPLHFGIVNVRMLDSSAYSVLGCGMDIRSWMPG